MSAFQELLGSDAGLLSLAVILFMLAMAGFFIRFFLRHMREDEARARGRR
ncbi:MAG: DUF3149 domain-containing protein [Comamonadaceae bacterium]|nr:DUF3149 domain-containing protein [Comamonadaceae bacterium]